MNQKPKIFESFNPGVEPQMSANPFDEDIAAQQRGIAPPEGEDQAETEDASNPFYVDIQAQETGEDVNDPEAMGFLERFGKKVGGIFQEQYGGSVQAAGEGLSAENDLGMGERLKRTANKFVADVATSPVGTALNVMTSPALALSGALMGDVTDEGWQEAAQAIIPDDAQEDISQRLSKYGATMFEGGRKRIEDSGAFGYEKFQMAGPRAGFNDSAKYYGTQIAQSVVTNIAPALLAGYVSKSLAGKLASGSVLATTEGVSIAQSVAAQTASLGLMGSQVYGQEYGTAMQENGGDHEAASDQAAYRMYAEIIPEILPMGHALDAIPNDWIKKIIQKAGGATAFFAKLGQVGFEEGLSEVVTEVANIAYDTTEMGKEYTPAQIARQLFDSFIVGMGMGGPMAVPSAFGAAIDAHRQKSLDDLLKDPGSGGADLNKGGAPVITPPPQPPPGPPPGPGGAPVAPVGPETGIIPPEAQEPPIAPVGPETGTGGPPVGPQEPLSPEGPAIGMPPETGIVPPGVGGAEEEPAAPEEGANPFDEDIAQQEEEAPPEHPLDSWYDENIDRLPLDLQREKGHEERIARIPELQQRQGELLNRFKEQAEKNPKDQQAQHRVAIVQDTLDAMSEYQARHGELGKEKTDEAVEPEADTGREQGPAGGQLEQPQEGLEPRPGAGDQTGGGEGRGLEPGQVPGQVTGIAPAEEEPGEGGIATPPTPQAEGEPDAGPGGDIRGEVPEPAVAPEPLTEKGEGLRYDPATNTHNGKKLVRGEVLQDGSGKRYAVDRDQGFMLTLDELDENGKPGNKSVSISVDPTDKDRFRHVTRTGEFVDSAGEKAPEPDSTQEQEPPAEPVSEPQPDSDEVTPATPEGEAPPADEGPGGDTRGEIETPEAEAEEGAEPESQDDKDYATYKRVMSLPESGRRKGLDKELKALDPDGGPKDGTTETKEQKQIRLLSALGINDTDKHSARLVAEQLEAVKAKEETKAKKLQVKKEARKRKVEDEGVDLKRWWDKLKQDTINAMSDGEKTWKLLDRMTSRGRVFAPLIPADATPGTTRYLAELQGTLTTFREVIDSVFNLRAVIAKEGNDLSANKIIEFLLNRDISMSKPAQTNALTLDYGESFTDHIFWLAEQYEAEMRKFAEVMSGHSSVESASKALAQFFDVANMDATAQAERAGYQFLRAQHITAPNAPFIEKGTTGALKDDRVYLLPLSTAVVSMLKSTNRRVTLAEKDLRVLLDNLSRDVINLTVTEDIPWEGAAPEIQEELEKAFQRLVGAPYVRRNNPREAWDAYDQVHEIMTAGIFTFEGKNYFVPSQYLQLLAQQIPDIETTIDGTPQAWGNMDRLRHHTAYENDEKDPESTKLDRRLRNKTVTRTGTTVHRADNRDVTPAEFKADLGFSPGVLMGGWVKAGEDQHLLNATYDALCDLAERMKIPRQAMGMFYKMYFTIGKLGAGRHAAHFSPNQPAPDGSRVPVINITKTKGDGSIAHEWGHALDYLTMRDDKAPTILADIRDQLKNTYTNEEKLSRIARRIKDLARHYATREMVDPNNPARKARVDNIKNQARWIRDDSDNTNYLKQAQRSGNPKYWANDSELFARSFEAFIFDTLGSYNNFLVNEWVKEGFIGKQHGYNFSPYPVGAEREAFNKMWQGLLESIVIKDDQITFDLDMWKEKGPADISAFMRDLDALIDTTDKEIEEVAKVLQAEWEAQEKLREEARKKREEEERIRYEEQLAAAKEKAERDRIEGEEEARKRAEKEKTREQEEEDLWADDPDTRTEAEKSIEELTKDPDEQPADDAPLTLEEIAAIFAQAEMNEEEGSDPENRGEEEELDLDEVMRLLAEGEEGEEPPITLARRTGATGDHLRFTAQRIASDRELERIRKELSGNVRTLTSSVIKGLSEMYGSTPSGGPGGKQRGSWSNKDDQAYALAKPHFQKVLIAARAAGKNLVEFVQELRKRFGTKLNHLYQRFIQDMGLSNNLSQTQDKPPPSPNDTAAGLLGFLNDNYFSIKTRNDLVAKLTEHFSESPSQLQIKNAQELIEFITVLKTRNIIRKGLTIEECFKAIESMYQSQLTLDSRSSTSMENQAYSTPTPLAYITSLLSGIDRSKTVYEPTAGNGALVMAANPIMVTANEINGDRARNLTQSGIKVTQNDATTWTPDGKFDVVVANPPFGALKDKVRFEGYIISKIDHLIAAKALSTMKDDGKGTIIIGASLSGEETGSMTTFLNFLYANYNVVSHFEVDGKLYEKQGTKWPVKVITVHGRKASEAFFDDEAAAQVKRLKTWREIYDQALHVLDSKGHPDGDAGSPLDTGGGAADGQHTPVETKKLPNRAGGRPGRRGRIVSRAVQADEAARAGQQRDDDGGGHPGVDTDGSGDGERPVSDGGSAVPGEPGGLPGHVDAAGVSGSDMFSEDADLNATLGSEFQTNYLTASQAGSNDGALTPVNMADSLDQALLDLIDDVGPVDEYVMNQLKYDSVEQMTAGLSGLQIDGIALAIWNHTKRNMAEIISDQTGVGKGRQAAGLIRYAERNGMIPVFVTEKTTLFTDMYYDLDDIGETGIKPFIINASGGENPGVIVEKKKDENNIRVNTGKVLFSNSTAKRAAGLSAMKAGNMPEGSNAIFLTYSQTDAQVSEQKAALEGLVASGKKLYFILDEAHTIAGEQSKAVKDKLTGITRRVDTRGGWWAKLIVNKATLYLSATYAKTPKNMGVYYRTALSNAVDNIEDIGVAISRGGEALMTVVSSMLTRAGQLVRRELSFADVSIEYRTFTEGRDEHVRLSNQVTGVLRELLSVDRQFRAWLRDGGGEAIIKADLDIGSKITNLTGQSPQDIAIKTSNFASVVHNNIKQLLLSLKVDNVVEEAIKRFKQDQKVVIALENTMESFLNGEIDRGNAVVGEEYRGGFRDVMKAQVDHSRRVTVINTKGDTENIYIPLDLLPYGSGIREAYEDIYAKIKAMQVADLDVFVIDAITARLEEAGMVVGEITGRKTHLVHKGGKKIVASRTGADKNRSSIIYRFNSASGKDGGLDAIIANAAGAVGVSLHASKVYKDQRKRSMIVAQAFANVNILMQMFGRVNRNGQVVPPEIVNMYLDIPSENRPKSIVMRNMRSLNALTSSNTESDANLVDASVLYNKYGDHVVNQLLLQNPDLSLVTGDTPTPNKPDGSPGTPKPGLALSLTGHLAVLEIDEQDAVWEVIFANYNALIAELDRQGINDLKIDRKPFAAMIHENKIVYQGKAVSAEGFGGDVVLHKVSVRMEGRPPTFSEVRQGVSRFLAGRKPQQVVDEILAELEKRDETTAKLDAQLAERLADIAAHKQKRLDRIAERAAKKAAKKQAALEKRQAAAAAREEENKQRVADGKEPLPPKPEPEPEVEEVEQQEPEEWGEDETGALVKLIPGQAALVEKYNRTKDRIAARAAKKKEIEEFLREHAPRNLFRSDINGEKGHAVVEKVELEDTDPGWDPYGGSSKLMFTLRVNNPVNSIKYPMSQLVGNNILGARGEIRNEEDAKRIFDVKLLSGLRENRYVITGNLPQAYAMDELRGAGTVALFSGADGRWYHGMLLRKSFNENDYNDLGSGARVIRSTENIHKYLLAAKGIHSLRTLGVSTAGDAPVRIAYRDVGSGRFAWMVQAPRKSTGDGDSVKYDDQLRAITGDFAGTGAVMEAEFDESRLKEVIDIVMDKVTVRVPMSGLSTYGKVTGDTLTADTKFSFDNGPNDSTLEYSREAVADEAEQEITYQRVTAVDMGKESYEERPADAPRGRNTLMSAALEIALREKDGQKIEHGSIKQVETPPSMEAAARIIQKVFGREVVFVEVPDSVDPFNGLVLPNHPKKIFINIKSKNPFMAVVGHELTHSLKLTDPQLYQQLSDIAIRYLRKDSITRFAASLATAKGAKRMSQLSILEELVGDAVGEAFMDDGFVRMLAGSRPSLLRRALIAFRNTIDRILGKMGNKQLKGDYFKDAFGMRREIQDALDAFRETRAAPAANDAAFDPDGEESEETRQRKAELDKMDILYQRPTGPVISSFFKKAGIGKERVKFGQRLKNLYNHVKATRWQDVEDRITHGGFDHLWGIGMAYRDLLGVENRSQMAGYVAARLSSGAATVMRGIMEYGAPVWNHGVISRVSGSKGLLDVLGPVKGELDNFLGWMIATRAERLMREGKENNFNSTEIQEALDMANGDITLPDGTVTNREAVYKKVAKDFDAFKKQILDVAQHAGLINRESRLQWDLNDWIPFYRLQEDTGKGPAIAGKRKGGLSHRTANIQKLRGGKEALANDPLTNIVMNFTYLISESMKNYALLQTIDDLGTVQAFTKAPMKMRPQLVVMSELKKAMARIVPPNIMGNISPSVFKGLTEMWGPEPPTGKNVVRVMRDGKAEYYTSNDPLLTQSIIEIDSTFEGSLATMLRVPKTILTGMVTADPAFIVRNFMRDALHTWVISDEKFVPVGSVVASHLRGDHHDAYLDLMFAGSSFEGGHLNGGDPAAMAKSLKLALRRKGYSDEDANAFEKTVMDSAKKLWDGYRRFGNAVENSNREAFYINGLRAGRDPGEMAYEAKDLMDFSMHGSWEVMQALAASLPFFNARLQGLHKLYRTSRTDAVKKMAMKGAVIAILAMILQALNDDDEDYQALEDWDKDTYWHFAPGTPFHMRFPKPFEVGFLFGTVFEIMQSVMTKHTSPQQGVERFFQGMGDQLAFNPFPQLFRPLIEVIAGKGFFTGRPIETLSDETKFERERFNRNTSELMVLAGPLLEEFGLSPKEGEFLLKGYFGTMGGYILAMADVAVDHLQGGPVQPALSARDVPVLKAFYVGSGPAWNTRYGSEIYELYSEAQKASSLVKKYEGRSDEEYDEEITAELEAQADQLPYLRSHTRALSKMRKEIDAIYEDENMSAEEKKVERDAILDEMNQANRDVYEEVAPAFGRK